MAVIIMRQWSFRAILIAILLMLIQQDVNAVSLWPDHVIFQSGGGMGILSVGTGWSYGANRQWETDIILGYIPQYDSSTAKACIALKENFSPWKLPIYRKIAIEPLSISIYFTSILHHKFWTNQPKKYPYGYYVLPTKIRANISLGQRVTWKNDSSFIKSISAFYEIGTCDLYLLSAFGNSKIDPKDYLQLCIGLRINF